MALSSASTNLPVVVLRFADFPEPDAFLPPFVVVFVMSTIIALNIMPRMLLANARPRRSLSLGGPENVPLRHVFGSTLQRAERNNDDGAHECARRNLFS